MVAATAAPLEVVATTTTLLRRCSCLFFCLPTSCLLPAKHHQLIIPPVEFFVLIAVKCVAPVRHTGFRLRRSRVSSALGELIKPAGMIPSTWITRLRRIGRHRTWITSSNHFPQNHREMIPGACDAMINHRGTRDVDSKGA